VTDRKMLSCYALPAPCQLTDDEVAPIEVIVREAFDGFES